MRRVYTAGVFDILHGGHLNLLWQSKQLGDVLIVGVVSDGGCHAYKGIYPHQVLSARMAAIRQIPWVDVVVPQAGTDPSENLRRFLPQVMTHANDWTRLREGHETLEELGIEWHLVEYTKGVSSTILREARNGQSKEGD
jgi:cytidyltransferase-like protein